MNNTEYPLSSFPRSRVGTFNVGRLGLKKHAMTGFLELDVTDLRKRIRAGDKKRPAVKM